MGTFLGAFLLVALVVLSSNMVSAYISCSNPSRAMGNWLGRDQECAALVQSQCNLPGWTDYWRPGRHVGSNCNNIPPLTAIATFLGPYGTYDHPSLAQHSAIFIRCERDGIRVFDQWRGQPISNRVIPWRGWNQNAGKAYYTIAT